MALIRLMAGIAIAAAAVMPQAARSQALLSPPQIEQLLAPIALYPDPLLGQVLMAATYPLEVAEAARWLRQGGNGNLRGEPLAVALQEQSWDPSVKSLAPFPQVLQLMESHLGWTQQLGDAFLAQPEEVMEAVQRLRAGARAAGTLYSTPQAVVAYDGAATTIEPADPQLIYVPVYDPAVAYGAWPYPDFPPYYFVLYPGYPVVAGIGYRYGVAAVISLWGWAGCDWHRHHLRIDHDRFNAINRYAIVHAGRPAVASTTWQHDPFHRRGVAYRDERLRERYPATPAAPPEMRHPDRGVERAPAASRPAMVTPAPAAPSAVPPAARPAPPPASRPDTAQPSLPAAKPAAPRPEASGREAERGRDGHREPEREHAGREPAALPAPPAPEARPRRGEPPQREPEERHERRER